MQDLAPILLFVYNRPWHTEQTLNALQKNELASQSELIIFSDAAKNSEAIQPVNHVREFIRHLKGFKQITVIERGNNWGLANSIINGVTDVISKYGRVIVLEDDLVTSPYFLRFMNDALERYKNKRNVWHISGYSHPFDKSGLNNHFFLKPTSCWGWATWSDRWAYFKKDSEYFLGKFDNKTKKDFNMSHSYDYYSQIEMNKKGAIDTWAIFWYATVFFEGGLSLHPLNSMTMNIGHDNSGVNCRYDDSFNVELETTYINVFPKKIAENGLAYNRLAFYYKSIKPSIISRIMNKILKVATKK